MLIALLRVLPKLWLSRLAGKLVSLRLPAPLQRRQILAFARFFGVDLSEVRDPIESFASLQAFFTRALRPDARPIDPAAQALVAPCDGAWGSSGAVERGLLLQVKGRTYPLAALLGDAVLARELEGGAYATLYLSPRDYHRFHTPCAGNVVRTVHLPGTLWPVNRAGIEGVPNLFAQNERLCIYLRLAGGAPSDLICLVAVGATNVGKVRVTFDDVTTNVPRAIASERVYPAPGPAFAKGDELGRFEFGSTIVMIASPGLVDLDFQPPGTILRLGRRIGTLHGPR